MLLSLSHTQLHHHLTDNQTEEDTHMSSFSGHFRDNIDLLASYRLYNAVYRIDNKTSPSIEDSVLNSKDCEPTGREFSIM